MQPQSSTFALVPRVPERLSLDQRAPAMMPRSAPASVMSVLVVEDDDAVRAACASMAASFGCRVRTANSVPTARKVLEEIAADVVFLDLRLPGGTGATLLEEIRSAHPRAFVVVMTAFATVNSAVELMRNGAGDFLPKPFALHQVTSVLERASDRRQWTDASRLVQDQLQAGIAPGRLVGVSGAMQKVFRIVSKVALTRHPVLILGERGTGKEVVARAIHANGPNAVSPFLPVDCDALEPERLEGELFGTDSAPMPSARPRAGALASAGEGTVYLNEIGALAPHLQARLARLLQERSGSAAPAPLRGRLIASSSRDLERLVEQGRFRKDLYYRLNIANLRVPPLRERVEDIPLLAEHFLSLEREERGVPFEFAEEVLQSLCEYDWAGNIAELESLVKHACYFSTGPVVHFEDLSSQIKAFMLSTTEPEPAPRQEESRLGLPSTLQEIERQAIEHALLHFKGDKPLAAKCLGIGKTTLYRKLKEYGFADDVA